VCLIIICLGFVSYQCFILICYYFKRRWHLSFLASLAHDVGARTAYLHEQAVPMVQREFLRERFRNLNSAPFKPATNHTHGISAAERAAASSFIDKFADIAGLRPYYVSKSASDNRNGRAGSRDYHWVKDVHVLPESYDPLPDDMLVYIDVDEYVPMEQVLSERTVPVLIYTFQSERVAMTSKECSYTFDEHGIVDYYTSGGGHYRHAIWNYSRDSLKVTNRLATGELTLTSYLVERRRTGPNREIVFLVPTKRWVGDAAEIANQFLTGEKLLRCNPNVGNGMLRMHAIRDGSHVVSTGRVGCFTSVEIPVRLDETIAAIASTNKRELLPSSVESLLVGEYYDDEVHGMTRRKGDAALLTMFHRLECTVKPTFIAPVCMMVESYQFAGEGFDVNAKPAMVPFMWPLMLGGLVPVLSKANDNQMVKGRMKDVASKVAASTFVWTCIREFIRHLVKRPHTLHPVDNSVVYERQNRPTQRAKLEIAELYALMKWVFNIFVKREAYQKIADPRPISVPDTITKREYSRYIYAFTDDVLKAQPWYGFGVTPIEISRRVTEILGSAKTAVCSDFSRFDGRVSQALRELELAVLMRAFHPSHHADVSELHRKQYGVVGFTSTGVKADAGYGRRSGSPETAAFNSIDNCFIHYLAFRTTKVDNEYITSDCAWNMIMKGSVYGGDDGVTADLAPKALEAAASKVGQVATIEAVQRGEFGIKFLNRMYGPGVWYGDLSSCTAIARAATKFHLCTDFVPQADKLANKNFEHWRKFAIDKLKMKALAYWLTDGETPFIGQFVTRVMQLGKLTGTECADGERWWAKYPKEVQFPNKFGNWMTTYALKDVPEYNDKQFTDWLTSCKTLEELLQPPCQSEPIPHGFNMKVVLNDQ